MSRYATITNRYRKEWREDSGMRSITNALDGTLAAMERLRDKADGFKKSGRYSEAGMADEIRKFAITDPAPTLRKGQLAVESFRENLTRCRNDLKIPKPDKSDVAGAILRMDVRNWLKGCNPGQLISILHDKATPLEILQAAFEVPPAMINATPDLMVKMQENLLEIHHGPTLERIAEMNEAASVVKATIEIALNDFRTVTMFDKQPDNEFRHWLSGAWTETERQHKAEMENEANRKRQIDDDTSRFAALLAPKPPTIADRRVDAIKAGEYILQDGKFLYSNPELNEAA